MMDKANSAMANSSTRDVFSLKNRMEKPSVIKSSTCPTARTEATFSSENAVNQHAVVMAPNRPTGQAERQFVKERTSSRLAIRNMIPPMKNVCNKVDVAADIEALSTISPVASESVAARKLTVDRPKNAPAARPKRDCLDRRDENRPDSPISDL